MNRNINIEATLAKLKAGALLETPDELRGVAVFFAEEIVATREVLLEILGELRSIRDRMSLDAACGFKSASEE